MQKQRKQPRQQQPGKDANNINNNNSVNNIDKFAAKKLKKNGDVAEEISSKKKNQKIKNANPEKIKKRNRQMQEEPELQRKQRRIKKNRNKKYQIEEEEDEDEEEQKSPIEKISEFVANVLDGGIRTINSIADILNILKVNNFASIAKNYGLQSKKPQKKNKKTQSSKDNTITTAACFAAYKAFHFHIQSGVLQQRQLKEEEKEAGAEETGEIQDGKAMSEEGSLIREYNFGLKEEKKKRMPGSGGQDQSQSKILDQEDRICRWTIKKLREFESLLFDKIVAADRNPVETEEQRVNLAAFQTSLLKVALDLIVAKFEIGYFFKAASSFDSFASFFKSHFLGLGPILSSEIISRMANNIDFRFLMHGCIS